MKIATVELDGEAVAGVVRDGGLAHLRAHFDDAVALLVAASRSEERERLDELIAAAPTIDLADCRFLPPVTRPRRILCVGTNYATHVAESDRVTDRPDHPMIFTRFPSSLVGHELAIVRPPESTAFDYEGELAIVIGRPTRRVTRHEAIAAIGGYSCFMDGTLRDWQRHTSQFTPGKNFDSSGSWGPWIVTGDEIDDPHDLRLTTTVDGNVVQDASTSQLIFDLADIIVHCSHFTTLEPGDVIATGTPGGVGYARDPQIWLEPGTEVKVEVAGVGELVNPVVQEAA